MSPSLDFEHIRHAEDVTCAARELYGVDLQSAIGVLHPTAVWESTDGSYITLRITGETPKSRHDHFVLNLARARADAFITTGKILRQEPGLETDLLGHGPEREALLEWRRTILGKPEPPLAVVLTSGRGLDLAHPFFGGWAEPVVFTTHQACESLFPITLERSVELVSHERPSISSAVEYLQIEIGCRTVSIEAGPSTSLALYRPTLAIDELLLSVYGGPTVPADLWGGAFLSPADVQRALARPHEPFQVEEPSGPWRFERWTR